MAPGDPRRVSMSSLLRKVAKRFDGDRIAGEATSAPAGRWMTCRQGIERAMASGVDVQGVCLYPVVDRPDWNNAMHWHNSGLFDNQGTEGGPERIERRLHLGYAKSLRRAQRRLAGVEVADRAAEHLLVFSHLRWHFASQRPDHVLSLLDRRDHVVFIEEPILTNEAPYLERFTPRSGVEVLGPHPRSTQGSIRPARRVRRFNGYIREPH